VAAPLILVWVLLFSPFAMALGIAVWAAAAFLLEAWHCRHPAADLLERVDAYRVTSIADEAQWWLDRQG
jgi:hypothetical protein